MVKDAPWYLLGDFIFLFVGILACWVQTILYVIWNSRKNRRNQLHHLHTNLSQIGMSWSPNEARFKLANEMDFNQENVREFKWFLLAGLVLSVASWLGFLVLAVLIMSLEFLAKPRLEKAVFQSELAKQSPLPLDVIKNIVDSLEQK